MLLPPLELVPREASGVGIREWGQVRAGAGAGAWARSRESAYAVGSRE